MEDTKIDEVNYWLQLFANVGIVFILWPLILAMVVVSFFVEGFEE